MKIGNVKNRDLEQVSNFTNTQTQNNNIEREIIPDTLLSNHNSKNKRIEEEVNKFIPDQSNEHKSLIKIKNIIPYNENNNPLNSPPSLTKKKRVLPPWITELPKKRGGK